MRLAEVPEPDPKPGQLVIAVHHVSLNHGDLNDHGRGASRRAACSDPMSPVLSCGRRRTAPGRKRGTVSLRSPRGPSPNVLPWTPPRWRRFPRPSTCRWRRPCPWPDLPRCVRSARAARYWKRVLITGASGGVGTFAVQMAAAAGAHVIASVGARAGGGSARGRRRRDRGRARRRHGACRRRARKRWRPASGQGVEPSNSRGQPAKHRLDLGRAGDLPSICDGRAGEDVELVSTFGDAGPDLTALVQLVATGVVTVQIGWRGSWEQVSDVVDAMRGRRLSGKAVLDVV